MRWILEDHLHPGAHLAKAPRSNDVSSVPSNVTVPDVGFSTWTRARPVVDLPHPDSPTRPSVSPSPNVKLTPATACTVLAPRLKETKRSSTLSSGSDEVTATPFGPDRWCR